MVIVAALPTALPVTIKTQLISAPRATANTLGGRLMKERFCIKQQLDSPGGNQPRHFQINPRVFFISSVTLIGFISSNVDDQDGGGGGGGG